MDPQEYFYDDGDDDLDYFANHHYHPQNYDYGDEEGAHDFETVSSISRLSAITDAILLSADPELGGGRILSLEPPQPDEGSIDRPMQPPIRAFDRPVQPSSPIDTIVAIRPMVTMGPKKEDPTFDTITFGDGVLKVRRTGTGGYAASDKSTDDENSAPSCDSSHDAISQSRWSWRKIVLLLTAAFIVGASVAYVFEKSESDDSKDDSLQLEPLSEQPPSVDTERNADLDFTSSPSISSSPIKSRTPAPTVSREQVTPTAFPTKAHTNVPTVLASSEPSQKPTIPPTMAPTLSPTALEEAILSALSTLDSFNPGLLSIPSSPQNLAYDFLLKTTQLNIHTPARIIQRYVMAVFYYATNGAGWERNAGWLDDGDECQWYSKVLAPCTSGGQLVRLNLPNNNLIGELPNELGLLSSIVEIHLGSNDLVGQVPTTFGNLKNIITINLSWTSIDGYIPPSLGEARLLENINLVGTSISGLIPVELGGLTNLEDLRLAETKITGSMPEQICALGLDELWVDCDAVPCPCCNYCCYGKSTSIRFCQYV
eukprot:scaffold5237_cov179-Amphora_coffeaeformis.AAC.16